MTDTFTKVPIHANLRKIPVVGTFTDRLQMAAWYEVAPEPEADRRTDEESLVREKQTRFRPVWYLVGTRAYLPTCGDLLASETSGTVVDRLAELSRSADFPEAGLQGGSQGSCAATGSQGSHLKCQYHRREFDRDVQPGLFGLVPVSSPDIPAVCAFCHLTNGLDNPVAPH